MNSYRYGSNPFQNHCHKFPQNVIKDDFLAVRSNSVMTSSPLVPVRVRVQRARVRVRVRVLKISTRVGLEYTAGLEYYITELVSISNYVYAFTTEPRGNIKYHVALHHFQEINIIKHP